MAPYTKTIVCLANSWKTGGWCVAGLEVESGHIGGWLRPVSERATREISFMEMRYPDFTKPALLDLVEIALIQELPEHHQTENHLIDSTVQWQKAGHLPANRLLAACQTPESLWKNGSSTVHGVNDCVDAGEVERIVDKSLFLIEPKEPRIEITREAIPGADRDSLKTRMHFRYNDEEYRLALTDPIAARLHREEGVYPLDTPTLLCVSLGEAFHGHCYKLVAGVIEIG